MNPNLAEILRAEISQMNNQQINVFKNELAETLPPAVKKAAEIAKRTSRVVPVGEVSKVSQGERG